MRASIRAPKEWLVVVLAVAVCTTALVAATSGSRPHVGASLSASSHAEEPTQAAAAAPDRTAAPTPAPQITVHSALATTVRTTFVRVVPAADAEVMSVVRAGILLPVTAESNGFVRTETPCELNGWVSLHDVTLLQRSKRHTTSLRSATIVIDPGHGGLDQGALGPHRLPEKTVNLDIATRLASLLQPARVVLTRTADYTAGLSYRTDIATALGAQLFLSVHNNSDPDTRAERPGTETYYQSKSSASKRLAGLTYEELLRALTPFPVSWVSARDAGAKYRINERGTDYYHVLRTSTVPAVIVEGLYISNPPEEALLARADVREVIAQALRRAIDRFVTTDDPGSGFVTPLPRASGPVFHTPSRCQDPA